MLRIPQTPASIEHPIRKSLSIPRHLCLNTNGDIGEHALGNVLAIEGLDNHVGVPVALALIGKDAVDVVGGAVDLGVADVGLEGHDLLAEGLVEEELAGADNVGGDDGAVAANGPVGVDLSMNVNGALDVEAGEDGLHLHDAVGVGGPDAAEPGSGVGVQVQVGADSDVELVEKLFEGSVRAVARERAVRSGLWAITLVKVLGLKPFDLLTALQCQRSW